MLNFKFKLFVSQKKEPSPFGNGSLSFSSTSIYIAKSNSAFLVVTFFAATFLGDDFFA